MPMIRDTLEDARLTPRQVTRIAVTCGPGSFTGIRVGVAAARGLALAVSAPAAGYTSLEMLAFAAKSMCPDRPVLAAITARGDCLYHQPFDRHGRPESPPTLSGIPEAQGLYGRRQGVSIGSGANIIADGLDGLAAITEIDEPPAITLLELAATSDPERWTWRPSPLYLRPPDARLPAGAA